VQWKCRCQEVLFEMKKRINAFSGSHNLQ